MQIHYVLPQAADNQIMASTASNCLNKPSLPSISKEVHLFDEITIHLLSVNKLCAGDLAVLFYGDNATVFKPSHPTITLDGEAIMLGSLDKETELYMVDVEGQAPW